MVSNGIVVKVSIPEKGNASEMVRLVAAFARVRVPLDEHSLPETTNVQEAENDEVTEKINAEKEIEAQSCSDEDIKGVVTDMASESQDSSSNDTHNTDIGELEKCSTMASHLHDEMFAVDDTRSKQDLPIFITYLSPYGTITAWAACPTKVSKQRVGPFTFPFVFPRTHGIIAHFILFQEFFVKKESKIRGHPVAELFHPVTKRNMNLLILKKVLSRWKRGPKFPDLNQYAEGTIAAISDKNVYLHTIPEYVDMINYVMGLALKEFLAYKKSYRRRTRDLLSMYTQRSEVANFVTPLYFIYADPEAEDEYKRVRISGSVEAGRVRVLQIDYGTFINVSIKCLYYLQDVCEELTSIPPQALEVDVVRLDGGTLNLMKRLHDLFSSKTYVRFKIARVADSQAPSVYLETLNRNYKYPGSSDTLFGNASCFGDRCEAAHCIYRHDSPPYVMSYDEIPNRFTQEAVQNFWARYSLHASSTSSFSPQEEIYSNSSCETVDQGEMDVSSVPPESILSRHIAAQVCTPSDHQLGQYVLTKVNEQQNIVPVFVCDPNWENFKSLSNYFWCNYFRFNDPIVDHPIKSVCVSHCNLHNYAPNPVIRNTVVAGAASRARKTNRKTQTSYPISNPSKRMRVTRGLETYNLKHHASREK